MSPRSLSPNKIIDFIKEVYPEIPKTTTLETTPLTLKEYYILFDEKWKHIKIVRIEKHRIHYKYINDPDTSRHKMNREAWDEIFDTYQTENKPTSGGTKRRRNKKSRKTRFRNRRNKITNNI